MYREKVVLTLFLAILCWQFSQILQFLATVAMVLPQAVVREYLISMTFLSVIQLVE